MSLIATRQVFDRNNPEPPTYLYVMRNRGHWRYWNNNTGKRFVPSKSLQMAEQWIEYKGLFIDVGCGQSPDAGMAVKHLGFRSAIKVDLWPPYFEGCGYDEWAKGLKTYEGRRVEFIQCDACKLSDYIPIESVDLINCNAMLDLMCADDRQMFYNEAFDLLAPYGILSVAHVPLAHGHGDWVHGRAEWNRIEEHGYAAFECLVCQKSALVLRRPREVSP